MRLKRMLLLVAMALGAVAVAAPAAQGDAPEWYHGETKVTGEEELHLEGSFSWTPEGSFFSGPCALTLKGTGSNVAGMAAGTITDAEIQNTCETSVPTCNVSKTLEGFPWSLTGATVTDLSGVEINGVQYTVHFEGTNCPVPLPTLTITGSITGLVDEEGCLSFEEHRDDLHLTIAPIVIDVRGKLCDTTLTLS